VHRLAPLSVIPLVLLLALVAGAARADAGGGKGGASPGILVGWKGAPDRNGKVRYVSLSVGRHSTVAVVRVQGGTVLRFRQIPGALGVPLVAYDGSTGGLAHDGRTLVLASPPQPPSAQARSRFVVLSAANLRVRRDITLRGSWSYDALSPDGRMLYLVEYVGDDARYRVRAYDLERGRLLEERIVDPRVGGRSMAGEPVTRLDGPGGVWAYTLYRKPGGFPFIHALNTQTAKALCIELPWRRNQDALWGVRLRIGPGGRTLELRRPGGATLATVDTRRFVVHAHAHPAAKSA
jgi:hypothetical protein